MAYQKNCLEMKYEIYNNLKVTDDCSVFDFVSVGRFGNIPKRIEFMRTEIDNHYNLAFGDVDEDGNIDDYSISDNGDRNIILATVDLPLRFTLQSTLIG